MKTQQLHHCRGVLSKDSIACRHGGTTTTTTTTTLTSTRVSRVRNETAQTTMSGTCNHLMRGQRQSISVQSARGRCLGEPELEEWGASSTRHAVIAGARRRVVFSNTFQASKRLVHNASVDVVSSNEEATAQRVVFHGMHHVGLLCENLERSLEFYQGILGLQLNPDRPDSKLPYRGAWLWIGPEMIHLMELPNPDPMDGRPEHGGRDRHFCVGVKDIQPLEARLKDAGVEYTKSMSGRAAIFFRDPDMNCLECVELHESWRT